MPNKALTSDNINENSYNHNYSSHLGYNLLFDKMEAYMPIADERAYQQAITKITILQELIELEEERIALYFKNKNKT